MESGPIQKLTIDEIITLFSIEENLSGAGELSPNIFPGQAIMAIIFDGKRKLVQLRWGLVPGWLTDTGRGQIHARAETVNVKPFFKDSFHRRRALVVTAGYYQWKKTGTDKTPYYIRMKTGLPFLMAALYERSEEGGGVIGTCAIITTEANDLVRPIHNRMPVIIDPEDMMPWLDAATGEERLMALLRSPGPAPLELVPGRFVEKQFVPLVRKPLNG